MTRPHDIRHGAEHSERLFMYVLRVLPPSEERSLGAHISSCAECRVGMETLLLCAGSLVAWPTHVLKPSESLWPRLMERIGEEDEVPSGETVWTEPPWETVAPGISCKILSTDLEHDRVSMLVSLE